MLVIDNHQKKGIEDVINMMFMLVMDNHQKKAVMSWYMLVKAGPRPPLMLTLTAPLLSSYPSSSIRMGKLVSLPSCFRGIVADP